MKIYGQRKFRTGETKVIQLKKNRSRRMNLMGHVKHHFVDLITDGTIIKGKVFPLQARLWPRGWLQVQLYSSTTTALEGVSGQQHAPAVLYPREKTRYPLYRRLVGPQCRSGRAENLAPTGIRSLDRPAPSQSLYRLSYPAHDGTIIL